MDSHTLFFSLSLSLLFCFYESMHICFGNGVFSFFFSQSVGWSITTHTYTHTRQCFWFFLFSFRNRCWCWWVVDTYTHDDEPNQNQNPHQTFPTTTKNTAHKHCTYIYICIHTQYTHKQKQHRFPIQKPLSCWVKLGTFFVLTIFFF